jgi:glutamate decarboxylase
LVPAYSLPANCEEIVVQRIVVRQGVSRDLASLLVKNLKAAIAHFEKHPVSVNLTEAEAGGFKHN